MIDIRIDNSSLINQPPMTEADQLFKCVIDEGKTSTCLDQLQKEGTTLNTDQLNFQSVFEGTMKAYKKLLVSNLIEENSRDNNETHLEYKNIFHGVPTFLQNSYSKIGLYMLVKGKFDLVDEDALIAQAPGFTRTQGSQDDDEHKCELTPQSLEDNEDKMSSFVTGKTRFYLVVTKNAFFDNIYHNYHDSHKYEIYPKDNSSLWAQLGIYVKEKPFHYGVDQELESFDLIGKTR